RGARSYIEITGFSKQRDLDPTKPGCGLEASMTMALANAGRSPNDVDYVSAYGPGHPVLDAAEAKMIQRVFDGRASILPVSSIKGVTGNPLAAGGPLQVACCALIIRDQIIVPTTNHVASDPDCDLDFVPKGPRRARIDCALVNVRGLGGSATSMVVNKVAADE